MDHAELVEQLTMALLQAPSITLAEMLATWGDHTSDYLGRVVITAADRAVARRNAPAYSWPEPPVEWDQALDAHHERMAHVGPGYE